jgi:hypothetical protein
MRRASSPRPRSQAVQVRDALEIGESHQRISLCLDESHLQAYGEPGLRRAVDGFVCARPLDFSMSARHSAGSSPTYVQDGTNTTLRRINLRSAYRSAYPTLPGQATCRCEKPHSSMTKPAGHRTSGKKHTVFIRQFRDGDVVDLPQAGAFGERRSSWGTHDHLQRVIAPVLHIYRPRRLTCAERRVPTRR